LRISLLALWLARVVFGGAFVALMLYEWSRWPNGRALLGPLGLVWYDHGSAEGLILYVLSIAMLFAFLLRPNGGMALVSLLGLLNRIFWGVMAEGIGC
jgi:hypothetical protein